LQLLEGSYLLLLALKPHPDIVRPIPLASFLDERQIFIL
jgi:hypothetical protein